jgi:hypothetical protein
MKGESFLKKIIYSSWFLAWIPAMVVFMIIPQFNSKYTLSVEAADFPAGNKVFSDLNSDTISALLFCGKGTPFYFISVRDNNLRFYDQWNLKDNFDVNLADFFYGNYDLDRFQEIYVFTHKDDSLFLNVNEFFEPSGTKLERVFIAKIGFIKGEIASLLKPAGFFDSNGDGMKELYFSIITGYGLEPRRMYVFDLVNKKLHTSQFTGTIFLNPRMEDIDEDLRPEIFGTITAPGNYHTKVPYSDNSTWFMVYNDQLKFEFPPVEFPGFANSLETFAYQNIHSKGYILSHCTWGTDTSTMKPRIMIYSTKGKLIRYRLYSDIGITRNISVLIINYRSFDRIYLLEDKLIELNEKLEVVRTIPLPINSKLFPFQADLNFDGENELLLYSESDGKLFIYDGGLHKLAESKFKTPDKNWKFSQYLSNDNEKKLFLSSGENDYFLKLRRNTFYYLGFLTYPGIYIFFFIFILAIRKINTYQVVQRESLKRRLITLQLQSVKSQLDPHFTFNALNSVASLIYLEDRKAAYDYMNKFTRLLRGILNDADRVYRMLGEELEIVTAYMDLEKLRFGDRFRYEIVIGESVTKREMVPKMVLQTFTENAIKHGLLPRTDGGKIKIIVVRETDNLKLTVEDNGIGRSLAEGHSNSTGRGLKITDEFYEILNQINKKPIKHTITDLYNESGMPSGTRVEILVPVEESVRDTT